jgi:uncharacterized protein YbcV (DUF1398 family)
MNQFVAIDEDCVVALNAIIRIRATYDGTDKTVVSMSDGEDHVVKTDYKTFMTKLAHAGVAVTVVF